MSEGLRNGVFRSVRGLLLGLITWFATKQLGLVGGLLVAVLTVFLLGFSGGLVADVLKWFRFRRAPRWIVRVSFGVGDNWKAECRGTEEDARDCANQIVAQRTMETGKAQHARYAIEPLLDDRNKDMTEVKRVVLEVLAERPDYSLGVVARVKEKTAGRIDLWRWHGIYRVLRDLLKEGYLRSWEGNPLPERGDRPRIYYAPTVKGREVLNGTPTETRTETTN